MLRSLVIAGLMGMLAATVPAARAAAPAALGPFTGYGQTPADAQQAAMDHARDAVQAYLNEKYGDLGWSPNADDLLRWGVVHVDPPTATVPKGETEFEAVARVDLSDPNLRKMQDSVDDARKGRLEPVVSERHVLVGRVVGSFVALFLVVFGYIRLEELTRGYYTTLLRLGAGAVVALAVLGLFLAF